MMKRLILGALIGSVVIGLSGCGGGGDDSKQFTATTSSFVPGSAMPSKYARKGDNINPAISWSNPPVNTKYIAVVMDDPDAKPHTGKTISHWAVYNVKAEKGKLDENISCPLPDDEVMSINSQGERAYSGPKPPRNDTEHEYHTYHFVVYGLKDKIDQGEAWDNDEMTNVEFKTKYSAIITGSAEFTGTYTRNGSNP